MSQQFPTLKAKEQRGSKPRCHLLADGDRVEVARRLTMIAGGHATVGPTDVWMPDGFSELTEARLDKAVQFTSVISAAQRLALREWWLGSQSAPGETPNWDIASTCTIEGRTGMLLVEAKAHDQEFLGELKGRSLGKTPIERAARFPTHVSIGRAVSDAAADLQRTTNRDIAISRDDAYQLSNRFAWSWKLAEMGIPVVLVYLGFLNAEDVRKPTALGETFTSADGWERLVKTTANQIVPAPVWGSRIEVNGTPFIPVLAAYDQPLVATSSR